MSRIEDRKLDVARKDIGGIGLELVLNDDGIMRTAHDEDLLLTAIPLVLLPVIRVSTELPFRHVTLLQQKFQY